MILAILNLCVHVMLPIKILAQSNLRFRRRCRLKNFKMANMQTCHKLLAEICEIRLTFRGDLTKFCEIFIKITFKLTEISLKPLF